MSTATITQDEAGYNVTFKGRKGAFPMDLRTNDRDEVDSQDVDDDGEVSLSIRVLYNSGCCGDEVASAEYEPCGSIGFEHIKEDCEGPVSLEVVGVEATDRYQETDRYGKPIKSFRYRRHYYGVNAQVKVTCEGCGAEAEGNVADEGGPPESDW
jgi:hypothetical protein